jgi:hypothetical protein
MAIAVHISSQHGSLTNATLAQQQSAARSFRIFFLATEASQY